MFTTRRYTNPLLPYLTTLPWLLHCQNWSRSDNFATKIRCPKWYHIRSDKCQQRGATFKRFIVVVYRSLRHAANHINGNKQFNCCAAVYAGRVSTSPRNAVGRRGGREMKGDRPALKCSSMMRLQQQGNHRHHQKRRPTPAPNEWLGKKSSRPAAHQPNRRRSRGNFDDFRRNFDLMARSA